MRSEKMDRPAPTGVARNAGSRPDSGLPPGQPSSARHGLWANRRRRRWRPLALILAVAVGAPATWWAATRPGSPTGSRAPAVVYVPFSPAADAYVSSARPNVNLGSSTVLRTSSRPKITSYLRFDLTDLHGTVTAATLRLWSDVADTRGAAVHAVGGSFDENSINASNAPAVGTTVALTGMVAAKSWVTADVTPLVSGDGQVSIALSQVGSGSEQYDSSNGAHPPELVVKTNSRALSVRSPSVTLRSAAEDVPRATAHRYATRDDQGRSMDTLKIIPSPAGGYLGVYHNGPQGSFRVYLAQSRDLLHWTYQAQLDIGASQPTICALPGSGFLLADEAAANPAAPLGPRLRFRHYASLSALLAGRADRTIEAPLTLASGGAIGEGTPDILSAVLSPGLSRSRITVGFHYRLPHGSDRPGIGTLTGFSSWQGGPDTALETALRAQGASGAIGDRDAVTFLGSAFELVEAQVGNGQAWHVYLYDEKTHQAVPLHIRTNQGSQSFGNPTVTNLRGPSRTSALVFTLFLRSSFAPSGETGELVYYSTYGAR